MTTATSSSESRATFDLIAEAGSEGGRVVAFGTPQEVAKSKEGPTAGFLAGLPKEFPDYNHRYPVVEPASPSNPMKRTRLNILLCSLLLVSLSLNAWQFFRPAPAPEVNPVVHAMRTAESKDFAGQSGLRPSNERTEPEKTKGKRGKEAQKTGRTEEDLAALPEDELIFGSGKTSGGRLSIAEPPGRMTGERLKELAKQKPSEAKKFRVHSVLHLPGGRVVDFGSSDIEPGSHMRFERLKEFPFPTSITFADADLSPKTLEATSFPVTPTTPGDFETRNQGIEIEVDVTPAPGTLVLGGQVTHRTFEGFGRMPGEAFSPIVMKDTTEGGDGEDVVLTENNVLQPQFSVSETPFLAAATAGKPCRVPVRMTFGQTILELTCTPVQ